MAEYTAAIQIRTEQTESGEAPPVDLRRLHRLRGDAYVSMKKWPEAVADYDHVITPETTDVDLLANRARAHEALKHWDRATADWTRAAAGSPEGANWLAALARRLVVGGQGPLPAGSLEQAQALYERALAADPGNDRLAAELAQLLVDRHESDERAAWTIVKPTEMKTEAGARLELNPDGSLFAHQSQPFQDDAYSLVFSTDGKAIKSLRLEVLADSRLPHGGPGWGANGNFLLNELMLDAAPAERPDEAKVIALRNARADFSSGRTASGDWHVEGAVDGNDSTGWAVYPRVNQDHTAFFELAEPVADGRASRLTVRLVHHPVDQWPTLGNLGRFRLSVSGDPADPVREQKRVRGKEARQSLGQARRRLSRSSASQQAALRVIAQHPERSIGHGRSLRGRCRIGSGRSPRIAKPSPTGRPTRPC